MEQGGLDSDGNSYPSRSHMWALEAGEDACTGTTSDSQKKQLWYRRGISYWEGVDASVDGVLGGYGGVSERDVIGSDEFLMEVLNHLSEGPLPGRPLVALDCGAGVGRVTKNLLLRRFHEVDLVEPVSHFLESAKEELKDVSCSGDKPLELHKAANFYCTSLQEFCPEPNRYDVIWVQWCIGHLTDQDFVAFFKRAKVGLKVGGFFILKENIAKNGFVVDKVDSSITRSDAYFRNLFQQAGLYLYKTKLQKGFPKELFAVRMYALTTQPAKQSPVAQQTRAKTLNQPQIGRAHV